MRIKNANLLALCSVGYFLVGCGHLQPTDPSAPPSKGESITLCQSLDQAAGTHYQNGTATAQNQPSLTPLMNFKTADVVAFEVPSFSQEPRIAPWEHITFTPFKTSTRFQIIPCNNSTHDNDAETKTIVRVIAASSVSTLTRSINRPVGPGTRLLWQWKVVRGNPLARINESDKEDSPIRVILTFDGDKSQLSEQEQGKLARMEMLTRRPSPYATLMYSVGAGVDLNHIETSRHTATVKIKAVQTMQTTGETMPSWAKFDRNIAKDFQKAFGEPPGKLLSISIMGDSDNTRHTSEALLAGLTLIDE